MTKRMLIDAQYTDEMRVIIAEHSDILEFDVVSAGKQQIKGNIYLAKVTRVEPSLQAAFVEYGGNRQGFLPFAEIHPDYYQIPAADRAKLLKEQEEEAAEAKAEEDAEEEEAEQEAENNIPHSNTLDADSHEETNESDRKNDALDASSAALHTDSDEIATEDLANNGAEPDSEQENNRQEKGGDASGSERKNAKGDGVETLPDEDEEISTKRRKRTKFAKHYKIQEVIKRGQVVLIQVIKEERGNKGAAVTSYLSLAGRYCVLMPNSPRDGGISRKIADIKTRKRLREVLSELKMSPGMSVIIRTAGTDRTRAEIRRDFDYLVKMWNTIRESTLSSTAPSLIYEENDLIKRAIRDLYTNDIEEVQVQGDDAYKRAREFMKMLLPSHTPRIKQYKEALPLFDAYDIEDQLINMHDPVVHLRSGGYLVINPTEALISIDINSGRSTGERNIEETATKTNLEAAVEIAHQLRLRDLAGLVVIDFIDMMDSRNRRAVERRMKDALRTDRAKIQIGRISPFGLLEMSRQRLRPSISELNFIQCPHCVGRGLIRSNNSTTVQIMRLLQREVSESDWPFIRLHLPENAALYMLNEKRSLIAELEQRENVRIDVKIDHDMTSSECRVERLREIPDADNEESTETPDNNNRNNRRNNRDRDRGSKNRGRSRDRERKDSNREEETTTEIATVTPTADAEPSEKRGGRGRGRNRRRWREDQESNGTTDNTAPKKDAHYESANENEGNNEGNTDADSLPSFTKQDVVEKKHPPKNAPVVNEQDVNEQVAELESTERPKGEPARRGWWQKMIELD